MQRNQEYITVIGLFALVAAGILLLSTPEDILSGIVVIDVSNTGRTPSEMLVTSVLDFKNSSELEKLPNEFGGLTSRDLNISESEAKLGAIMKRMYSDENNSILFMILSSQNMTEYHNLQICYSGNWNITEKELLEISSEKLGEEGYNNIKVNEFFLERNNLKQIILYWYQWDGGIVRTDKNYMLIQIGIPVKNTSEEAELLAQNFTKEYFLKMYKPVQRTNSIAEQIAQEFGILGILLDAILILIPVAMIFNSKIVRTKEEQTVQKKPSSITNNGRKTKLQ